MCLNIGDIYFIFAEKLSQNFSKIYFSTELVIIVNKYLYIITFNIINTLKGV